MTSDNELFERLFERLKEGRFVADELRMLRKLAIEIKHDYAIIRSTFALASGAQVSGRYRDAFIELRDYLIHSCANTELKWALVNYLDAHDAYAASNHATAVILYEKAISQCPSSEFWVTAAIKSNLAVIYLDTGDFEKVLTNALESIEIWNSVGKGVRGLTNYINIAAMMTRLNDYLSAIEIIKLAQQIAQDGDIHYHDAHLIYLLGCCYTSSNPEEAINCFLQAINCSLEQSAGYPHMLSRLELGLLYAEKGLYQQSLIILSEAHEYFKQTGVSEGEYLTSEVYMGYAYYLAGDPEKALEYILPAVQALRKVEEVRRLAGHYLLISKIYGSQNRKVEAYDYYKLHQELMDTMRAPSVTYRLTSTQIMLALEKQKQEERLKELETTHLQSQITNTTLQLLAQTELLSNFRNEIREIVRRMPAIDPLIRELKEKLKALPCESINWEQYDAQFQAAHPDFSKKLAETYPDLTATELRVCSLVRMNLRSDEIARLFCLSERTVESHRFWIRKKLGLSKGEDLAIFLAKL